MKKKLVFRSYLMHQLTSTLVTVSQGTCYLRIFCSLGTPSVAVGEEKKPLHATPHSFAEPTSGVATRTAEEVALKGKLCFWTATQKGNLELLEIISRIGADEDGRKRQAQLPELML
ncbi:hypothetical protein XENORESO_008680 [Xenotaenia resolanae]|uniref:Uncharacterized protein n=1 Tax=Xenotaenia resolanae TaxID=208358 RepID=A0ABV0WJB7_9TELE